MTKDLRDRWVAALRSGKFKQGKDYLQRYGRFCCLGVLCEVAAVPYDADRGCYRFDDEPHWTDNAMVTGRLRREIDGRDLERDHYSYARELAELNDEGCNFVEIADWIEDRIPVEA